MDIFVGGITTFAETANSIKVNDESGIADKCNIVLSPLGVEVVKGDYEKNGVVYSSGVHFASEY